MLKLIVPPKLEILKYPKRYKVIRGGRSSAKSWTVARYFIYFSCYQKLRFLCVREIQNSMKESVIKLLAEQIEQLGFIDYFDIKIDIIINKITGSEFIFYGLYRNITRIQSIENINYCWVEQAERISMASFKLLIPTIRVDDSEIWFTCNPENEDDPIETEFVNANRDDTIVVNINYMDNPWLSKVSRNDMEYAKKVDYGSYLHVWEGHYITHSNARVFAGKWRSEWFESTKEYFQLEKDLYFYFGADWGFSQDPAVLLRCFIIGKTLYIDYEIFKIGLEIEDTPDKFEEIPESKKYPIVADSQRPDTISHMQRHGYPLMRRSKKGKGSVEDGISFLKSFEKIIIHSRCVNIIDEFKLYSYIVNKLTGEITRKLEDKHNHGIDSCRYAIESLMRVNKIESSGISAGSLGL